MNKEKFLKSLKKGLIGLPKEEIDDICSDFEEHFRIGKKDKRSEEELSYALGDPNVLARQLKAASYLKKAEETESTTNISRAVFASIGLGFFNLLFILPPFLCLAALVLTLFAVAVGLSASGIAGLFASVFYPFFSQLITFSFNPAIGIFGFLGIAAFGILFFIGVVYLSRVLYRLMVRYLKFNLGIIRGEGEKNEI